jgi:diguanylate cyclase (GGDEF)-like protein
MTIAARCAAVFAVIAVIAASVSGQSVAVFVACAGIIALAVITDIADRRRRKLDQLLAEVHSSQVSEGARVARERDELTNQLQFWATHDPLTGLANRALFARALSDGLRNGRLCGVLTISLADFAAVNSTYGPAIGDNVLQTVSSRLQHALRAGDVVARVGGDEFAVLLHDLDLPDAQAAGRRLVSVLDHPIALGSASVVLRARAGVAVSSAAERVDALELVRRAEVAATTCDIGEVHVFAPELQAETLERKLLEADLRRAIEANEFRCHYQPLVDPRTGRISSLEALVRWEHPTRGMVRPDEFIPAAERCGLIVPLGLHVLEEACQQLRAWRGVGGEHLSLAVNLSARQLAEPGLVEAVRAIVWGAAIDPRCLVLEITESLLVDDGDAAIATLWQLRGLGLRLAVDDFGTGYSSLSRLSELPIDEMKIDKSFTDRIGAQHNDSAPIISAAVAMGHALGLMVVAEGVETADQAEFLAGVGVDLLQGYLLSRPVEAETAGDLLGRVLMTPVTTPAPAPVSGLPRQRSDEAPSYVPAVLPSIAPSAPSRPLTR